jgi:glycerol-3-phosphate dehydrogenase
MARDLLARAAVLLRRERAPRDDAPEPLPMPLADETDDAAFAEHAAEHEWARGLEDVLRRRGTRWLANDRGLAAARRMAPVLARRLGWDAARERDELERYEAAVRDELLLLDRTLAAR